MASSTNTMKRSNESCDSTAVSLKKLKFTVAPMRIQLDRWIDTVISALASEETSVPGPASCRAMLVAAAPAALQIPKEKRHAHQEAMIHMLREIFNAEKASWQARVAAAQSALETATAEESEKVGMKEAKDAELRAQKQTVHVKFEAQAKADEVVEECKEDLATALASHTAAETTRRSVSKMRESDLALQEIIQDLKTGKYENPKDLRKHISAVTERLQSLAAEDALVKTLPQILRRKPEDRGNFDEMALQQLDSYMTEHLSSLNSDIEGADQIVGEHTTAVTAWEATVEVAEDKKKKTDDALNAALAEQEHLQKEVRDARKIVKEHTAVVKRKEKDLATENFGLQYFEEVLETLDFLQEWECVPTAAPVEAPVEALAASIEPTTKAKEADVAMDIDVAKVPSPTKKSMSLGGEDFPTVLA